MIRYSIAHDTLFNKADGVVVVGAYSFQIPNLVSQGDEYFIQLGSPSATRDGVGAPGADVYIQPPASNRVVTVGTPSYLVGDVAPFHWLNAGDFGDTNLNNADVMQVFQSAILGLHMPPVNSDLFRAMDSCGRFGKFDAVNQYFVAAGPLGPADLQAMFDGSNPAINCVAFGDASPTVDSLDVCDVFVTFRRSLDPSLAWFRRFWTNGQFVAVQTTNLAFNSLLPTNDVGLCSSTVAPAPPSPPYPYQQSSVSFAAGDAVVSAGQTIQIPITAKTSGIYPLRVLGLNITVRPLDGSPGLTQPIQFAPAPGLGPPTFAASKQSANFSGAWLDGGIPGLTGDATLGTLTITVPANATAASAYAIHFDHASASPNGIASLPNQTQTGLIMASDRSASSWNDGIPDAWRLRYFGTLNNLLSASTADADGDGVTNLDEFRAGTDPNNALSKLQLRTSSSRTPGPFKLSWPTVLNKRYVLEGSSTLSGENWTVIAANIVGDGSLKEFSDTSNSSAFRFYRVRAE